MSKLKENIKKLRLARGWTQLELGQKMGKTADAVSNWERGKNKMDTDDIELACHIFGVTPEELLGWEGEQTIKETANEIAQKILSDENVKRFISLPVEERKRLIEIAEVLKKEG